MGVSSQQFRIRRLAFPGSSQMQESLSTALELNTTSMKFVKPLLFAVSAWCAAHAANAQDIRLEVAKRWAVKACVDAVPDKLRSLTANMGTGQFIRYEWQVVHCFRDTVQRDSDDGATVISIDFVWVMSRTDKVSSPASAVAQRANVALGARAAKIWLKVTDDGKGEFVAYQVPHDVKELFQPFRKLPIYRDLTNSTDLTGGRVDVVAMSPITGIGLDSRCKVLDAREPLCQLVKLDMR